MLVSSQRFTAWLAVALALTLFAGTADAAIFASGPMSPQIPAAGVGQSYSAPGTMTIGTGGFGLPAWVSVDASSELSAETFILGEELGSLGQLTVSDFGASVVGRSGNLTIGQAGEGSVTASGGALIDFFEPGTAVRLGSESTGVGRLELSDSGTAFRAGSPVLIGDRGRGDARIDNGATLVGNNGIRIGDNFGSVGVVEVDGAGSRIISTSDGFNGFTVGNSGYGELHVTDGGSVQTAGPFGVGERGGSGLVTVDGIGSRLSVAGNLTVGSPRGSLGGVGQTLRISNQGLVDADVAGTTVSIPGRLELDGGTLLTSGAFVNGVVAGDGAISGVFTLTGGTIEVGQGQRLRLTPNNTASGDVMLNGGRLELAGSFNHSGGDITLRDGAVLSSSFGLTTSNVLSATSGVSDVYGQVFSVEDLVVARDSTLVFHEGFTATNTSLQTGGSIVSLAPVFLDPMAVTSMAISEPGGGGAISVSGSIDLAGDLVVSASADVEEDAQVGDIYPLIDASTLNGAFGSFDLPTLSGGRFLRPQQTATGFELVVEGSIPGDYNFDGVVDAADYGIIRDGLGTIYTDVDLAVWRAYYGTVLVSPATSVPEPATAALVAAVALVGLGVRRV